MKQLQIIIPVRIGGNPYITLASLGRQTFQDFDIVISQDDWQNANRARNEGLAIAAPSKYVLFSDDDIEWKPDALRWMIATADTHPHVSWVYGTYLMGGRAYCQQPYSPGELRKRNLCSTMSIIRRADFPGFDESIERLQDYDLWLTMAARDLWGRHCGHVIFDTAVRDGITRGGKVSYEEAFQRLKVKHGL